MNTRSLLAIAKELKKIEEELRAIRDREFPSQTHEEFMAISKQSGWQDLTGLQGHVFTARIRCEVIRDNRRRASAWANKQAKKDGAE